MTVVNPLFITFSLETLTGRMQSLSMTLLSKTWTETMFRLKSTGKFDDKYDSSNLYCFVTCFVV